MGKVSFKYGTASQLANAPYLEGTFYVISDNNSTDGILYADLNNKRICFGDVASLVEDVSDLESSIPTKVSELTNDSGFLTSFTETDPIFSASAAAGITSTNISNWNKKIDKQFMGYLDDTALYYPIGHSWGDYRTWTFPFILKTAGIYVNRNTPVRAINSTNNYTTLGTIYLDNQIQTGNVYLNHLKLYICTINDGSTVICTVATLSDIPDTSLFLTSETDPTVPSWAKESTKPSYTFSEISSTPTTINGYGITDAYTKTQVDGLVAGITIPTVPTNVSSFTNDSGYLTIATLPVYDGTVV